MIYVEVLNHSRNFKCPSAIECNLCSVAFALLEDIAFDLEDK